MFTVDIGNVKNEPEHALLVRDAKTLHRKMGHLGIKNLKKLVKMVDGVKESELPKDDEFLCEVCVKAKHARSPFSGELPKATRELEIIHTDVCGPIETETYDGKRYFITFLEL